MVAGKSILDPIDNDSIECGNRNKITTNLDTNQSSSFDKSMKCNGGSEHHADRLLGSGAEDGTEEDLINLNSTYLSSKPNAFSCNIVQVQKNDNFDDLSESKFSDGIMSWDITQHVLNFAKSFDVSRSNSELYDLKIENKMLEKSKLLAKEYSSKSLLLRMRNHLAEFQEARGTSREEYNYATLMKMIGRTTGRCLFALSYIILNVIPVLEIFLHILRFVLDKLIDIKNSQSSQQMLTKGAIFSVQLFSIYICLIFIFGFIVLPIIRMIFGIIAKILLYD